MLRNTFVKNMLTYELVVSQAVVRQVESSTGKTDRLSKQALLSAKRGVKMHLIFITITGTVEAHTSMCIISARTTCLASYAGRRVLKLFFCQILQNNVTIPPCHSRGVIMGHNTKIDDVFQHLCTT